MRNLLILCTLVILTSCGKRTETIQSAPGADGTSCYAETRSDGNYVVCGDSEFKVEDGKDGVDGKDGEKGDKGDAGQDGKDGADGQDGAGTVINTVSVSKGQCVEVATGIWVENIQGNLFDVYSNPSCSDNQGEYCDNVSPSFGKSGSLEQDSLKGSASVCWAGDIMISGSKESKNSNEIDIKVVSFGQTSFDGYFDVVELCPEKPGSHIETLLYLDGKYLAFLSDANWKKQRLVTLSEGTNYSSTDGRNINFIISGSDIVFLTNGCATYSPAQ